MDRVTLVYTTFPDETAAMAVGETLVRDGLSACVNVLPAMRSVFRWKGEVERATEVIALVKTTPARQDEVGAALKARHPYETPVILFLGPFEADRDTLAWLAQAVARGSGTVPAGPARPPVA